MRTVSIKILTASRIVSDAWPRAVTIAKMRPSRNVLRSVLKDGPAGSPAATRASAARVSRMNAESAVPASGSSWKSRNAASRPPTSGMRYRASSDLTSANVPVETDVGTHIPSSSSFSM